MKPLQRNGLSFLHWNISGAYVNICGDSYFKVNESSELINLLSKHDIFCLTETHCGYNNPLKFEGHVVNNVIRPKSVNAKKHNGGIAIGVRENLRKGIKYEPKNNACKEYQWLKLKREFFNLERDIFLPVVYVPPYNSPVHNNYDIFSLIEEDIAKFSMLGDCLACGTVGSCLFYIP